MSQKKLIECVPNFSEGRDLSIIKQITDAIESVEGIRLLDVDPGKATNRTVVTFVGEPQAVIEAAYNGIKKASEVIDMSKHKGEHPRMGATDVCPLIPISNVTLEEVAQYAHELGQKVGKDLNIPFYMYEAAATSSERKNLASVRAGEYEGLAQKLMDPKWKPDYGPNTFNPRTGATAIGARDFLIAYNVNLNTTSVRRANSVAFDVREKGRIKREGNPITGKVVTDEQGNPVREAGMCKSVKAIGWYIEEYGFAQISMNLTDIHTTPLHIAFEACRKSANNRGLRVTGSEMVGLVPKKVMIDAGKYFLEQQNRSTGVDEEEIIKIAISSLGLSELSLFDPKKKIIEYVLDDASNRLVDKSLKAFVNETASESPAPGGGSVSASIAALGVSLGTMVANLSAHKRGWDDQVSYFSSFAEQGQRIKDKLLALVDEDTQAFNQILEAVRMPKASSEEKVQRKVAMKKATQYAIEVPLQIIKTTFEAYPIIKAMSQKGIKASITDAGVGALACHAAIQGAYFNVLINCKDFDDQDYIDSILKEANEYLKNSKKEQDDIINQVHEVMKQ